MIYNCVFFMLEISKVCIHSFCDNIETLWLGLFVVQIKGELTKYVFFKIMFFEVIFGYTLYILLV